MHTKIIRKEQKRVRTYIVRKAATALLIVPLIMSAPLQAYAADSADQTETAVIDQTTYGASQDSTLNGSQQQGTSVPQDNIGADTGSSDTTDNSNAITYSPLSFNSNDTARITIPVNADVRRYEILYEVSKSDNKITPGGTIDINGQSYNFTYGHAQTEDSPIKVKAGREIESDNEKKNTIREIVLYIDTKTSGYSGTAELTLMKNHVAALAFAQTAVPDDYDNIASGDEAHLKPAAGKFYYFIDQNGSFYTVDDLAKIESEGTSTDTLQSVAPPEDPKPDYTKLYILLGTLAAVIIAAFVGISVFFSNKRKKKERAERMARKKARRRAKIDKIKNSEDLAAVLEEEDYSDDDYEDEDDSASSYDSSYDADDDEADSTDEQAEETDEAEDEEYLSSDDIRTMAEEKEEPVREEPVQKEIRKAPPAQKEEKKEKTVPSSPAEKKEKAPAKKNSFASVNFSAMGKENTEKEERKLSSPVREKEERKEETVKEEKKTVKTAREERKPAAAPRKKGFGTPTFLNK